MRKIISIALLITSLICYLEWGKDADQSGFLFKMEYDLFFKKGILSAISHPLVLMPLLAQILLVFTIFQRKPSKLLILISALFFSLLVIMVLLTGILSKNWKIILSTLPFLSVTIFLISTYKRR